MADASTLFVRQAYFLDGSSSNRFAIQANGPAAWRLPGGANAALVQNDLGGDLRLCAAGVHAGADTSNAGVVTVKASTGWLGLLTTAPRAALDVSGDVCATTATLSRSLTASCNVSTSNVSASVVWNPDGDLRLAAASASNGITVQADTGWLGVLTSNPQAAVDVSGSINISGDVYQNGVLYSVVQTNKQLSWGTTVENNAIVYANYVGANRGDAQYPLDVSGDANFTGRILQRGAPQWNVAPDGASIAYASNVAVAGAIDAASVALVGAATVGTDLAVAGAASVGTDLAVAGAANVGSNLAVAGAASVGSNLAVAGAASVGTNLAVAGAANVGTNLAVAGAATFESSISCWSHVAVSGYLHVGAEVEVTGAATFWTDASVAGAATVGSNLTVAGAATVGSNLTVAGAAAVGSNLTVAGAAAVGSNLTVAGAAAVGRNLAVGSNLDVGGATTVGSNLTVRGAATVGSNLAVGGAATVGSNLAVGGAATVGSNLAVGGAATFASNVTVAGAFIGSGAGLTLVPLDQFATGSLTQGGVTYSTSATSVASTGAGSAGDVLTSGGPSPPSWSTRIALDELKSSNVRVLGTSSTVPALSVSGYTSICPVAIIEAGQHEALVVCSNGAVALGKSWAAAPHALDVSGNARVSGFASFQQIACQKSAADANQALDVGGNARIAGTVTVEGTLFASNVAVLGSFETVNAFTSSTSNVAITNAGPGPALAVTQSAGPSGPQPVAAFYAGSAVALAVDSNGAVAVGKSAAATGIALDVNGAASISGALAVGGGISGSVSGIADLPLNAFDINAGIKPGGIAYGASSSALATIAPTTTGWVLLSGGGGAPSWSSTVHCNSVGVGINTMAPTSSYALAVNGVINCTDVSIFSDRDYKERIAPIRGALDKVMRLNGVTFAFRDDPAHREHVGLIAQDVEAVMPQAVTTDDAGRRSLAYPNLVGLLVEAIKEQQAAIAALQKQHSPSPHA